MRYIRWKALLPLSVFLVLLALWTLLFKDPVLRWTVEKAGSAAVGAKVDLADAHWSLTDGNISLRGLQVTNPKAPMTNLFEVEELVLDIGMLPALEKKVVVDTIAARGLRFGTARATSGELPRSDEPEAARASSAVVENWKSQVKVPSLDLSTLQRSVNVDAISADSLATLRAAAHARAYADTARAKFLADLAAADPRPVIDSAEALSERLRTANLRTLGLPGARRAVTDVRRTLAELGRIDDRLKTLESEVQGNAAGLTQKLEAIPAARVQDYAYARSLLQLPSFDIPSIGPQLMSDLVAEQFGGVLYWMQLAEQYTPPGLKRKTQAGPERIRASGTTVMFPKETVYPSFLMRVAELSLTLAGEGATAGNYSARIDGATTEPAVYGAPTTFRVERVGTNVSARDIRVGGSFDHRAEPVRDSVSARMVAVPLPTVELGGLGASVDLGTGLSDLRVTRTGNALRGEWTWRAPHVQWTRDTTARATTPRLRAVEDALWRALSRMDSVEIAATFGGTIERPTLGVRTNIASAVGNALREQLGEEVRRAEQQVRSRVDALVDSKVTEARGYADRARSEVNERIGADRARLQEQKTALEARLRELTRIPGIG
jgi:uncharacterized protein (TIGR03545 family)